MVGFRNKINLNVWECIRIEQIMIEMFTNSFSKLNLNVTTAHLFCSGKFFAQTQVGQNGLIFGMASNLDVP